MKHLSVVCLSICNEKLDVKTTLMRWDISFAKKLIFLSVRQNFKMNFVKKPLSDCNGIRTQNHLVRKRALNHLESSCSCSCSGVQLQSLNLQISRLLRAKSFLTFRQLSSVDSLWNAYVTWQELQLVKKSLFEIHFKYLIHAFLYIQHVVTWN